MTIEKFLKFRIFFMTFKIFVLPIKIRDGHDGEKVNDCSDEYLSEARLPETACMGKAAVGDCRNNSGYNDALEIE